VAAWDNLHRPTAPRRHHHPPATPPTPTTLWNINVGPGPSLAAVTNEILYAAVDSGFQAIRVNNGNVLWKTDRSFLAVSNSRSVIYAADTAQLYALNATNGRTIWRAPIAYPTTPVASGGILYTADHFGTVHALRSVNGQILWSFATSQGEPSGVALLNDTAYTAGSNAGASVFGIRAGRELWKTSIGPIDSGPTISDQIILVYSGFGTLYALRPSNGSQLWKTGIASPKLLISTANGLLVSSGRDTLYKLDPHDGSKLWTVPGNDVAAVLGNMIFTNYGVGKVSAIKSATGTEIWTSSVDVPVVAAVAAKGTIYIASNNLYALRATDGTKTWSLPIEVAVPPSLLLTGDIICLATQSDEIIALDTSI
jgi:outer membrane protein assembly factor BamB